MKPLQRSLLMSANSKTKQLIVCLIFTAVFFLAFALRIHNLTAVPPGLSGDEGINAGDALRIGADFHPLFFTQNSGREPLFLYSMGGLFQLVGASAFAARYVTVLYSLLGLTLTYVLVRRLWNWPTAVVTITLIAISFWPLYTSRVALRAITMLPLQALALYALLRGLKNRSWFWLTVSGFSLGLLFYTYIPGRLFLPVLLVWFVVTAVFNRQAASLPTDKNAWFLFLFVGGLALLVMAPLVFFIWQQPEAANQRFEEVGGTVEALQQGDLAPALNGAWLTAQMFSLRGDPSLRYNIPERPLYDWVTALFFYIGVAMAVWRRREPRYSLLLIWLPALLLPTILSDRTPAFLRSVGALIPIYILVAVALLAFYRQLVGLNWRYGRMLGTLIVIAILLGHGINSGIAYFRQWPAIADVKQYYGDRVDRLAAELDKLLPLPDGSDVMVVCHFAIHVCQDMIHLQTHYEGEIQPFAGYAGLVIPASAGDTGDLVYLFAHALPLPAAYAEALAPATQVHWQTSPGGKPETAVYHLPASVRQAQNWLDGDPVNGRFYQGTVGLNLVAASLPDAASRGGEAEVTLYWQIPPDYAWDGLPTPRWTLLLTDEAGNELAGQSNIFPYESQDWQPGDIIIQAIPVPVPGDVPPGELFPRLQIGRPEGEFLYQSDDGEIGRYVALSAIEASGVATVPPPEQAAFVGLDGELGLVETAVPSQVAPGLPLNTSWRWYVTTPPEEDYALTYRLCAEACSNESVFETTLPIWPEQYPSSRWQAGEMLRLFQSPTIPADLPNGSYELETVLTDGAGKALQTVLRQSVEINGRSHTFTIPQMAVTIDQPLSDGIHLLGYDLHQEALALKPGDSFDITVHWQATAPPTQDYTTFVHLYNSTGQIIGQDDRFPCDNLCLTSTWLTGEVISNAYHITIDATAVSGQYSFGFGMYHSETFQRLQIPNTSDNVIITPAFIME